LKISTEFKIGFVVVLSIAIAYWGINYLKGNDVFSKERVFYGVYDRIDGLAVSSPVNINGFAIGLVREIKLLPGKENRILVRFDISNDDVNIPAYTEARIVSVDLLGSKQVTLLMGNGNEYLTSGDTLNSSIEGGLAESVNKQIAPLKIKAEELLGQVEKAVVTVQSVFDENARENLSQSFMKIKESFINLSNTAKRLDSLMIVEKPLVENATINFAEFMQSLNDNKENLNRITYNLALITDSLRAADLTSAVANASDALKNLATMIDNINKGQGTVGKLMYNDSLYNELTNATIQLKSLLEDIETNPDRYIKVSVFGKKEKKLKLSDKDVERIQKYIDEQNN